jgi:hypothetical protein
MWAHVAPECLRVLVRPSAMTKYAVVMTVSESVPAAISTVTGIGLSAASAPMACVRLAGDDHADIARSRSQGDRVRGVRRPGRGSVEVDKGGLRQVPGGDKSEVWACGGVKLVIFAAGLGLVALGYYLASRRRTKAGALNLEGAHS